MCMLIAVLAVLICGCALIGLSEAFVYLKILGQIVLIVFYLCVAAILFISMYALIFALIKLLGVIL